MFELVLATNNKNKIKEIKQILKGLQIRFYTFEDFENIENVIEDGNTFEENAVKKAREIAKQTGKLTLADDSGIEVYVLNNEPGVRSSRYAGENATDMENMMKLLDRMKGFPPERRGARFVCVIALADKENLIGTVTGSCEGIVLNEPRGGGGFGYDPVFAKLEYGKSFAELDLQVKNRISHRANAIEKIRLILERLINRES